MIRRRIGRLGRWIRMNRTLLRSSGIATLAFVVAAVFAQWWDFTVPALRSDYQAVFLTNGQTYFGRYFDRIGAYAKIEDVYYIQQVQNTDTTQPAEARLLRRGAELHAPDPRMLIPKTAILFVEDLKADSPISKFMRQDRR